MNGNFQNLRITFKLNLILLLQVDWFNYHCVISITKCITIHRFNLLKKKFSKVTVYWQNLGISTHTKANK